MHNYLQVSAGLTHTVFLLTDGSAVAYGSNEDGQCDMPVYEGLEYTQVSAGVSHSVLLRSDGIAVHATTVRRFECPLPRAVCNQKFVRNG